MPIGMDLLFYKTSMGMASAESATGVPLTATIRSRCFTPGQRASASRTMPLLPRVKPVCGASLTAPAERKVGRCASCPPTYDEELLERLRQWRSRTAGEAKVPTYVVFTDATLVAIAETLPRDRAALAGIPGVGPAKLERYGEDVLAVLTG